LKLTIIAAHSSETGQISEIVAQIKGISVSPITVSLLSVMTIALLLSAIIVQQKAFAAPILTVNQTVLSLAISPSTLTEPSGTTITATLTYLANGQPVKGDTVYIQRAANNLACSSAILFSNVFNAKTNSLGQVSYTVTSTAGLGGNLVGFKANHPLSTSGKITNTDSTSACKDLTILPPLPPSVSISQPTSGQQFSSANVDVRGSASAGSYPLAAVIISTDGGTPSQTTGTTSWNITLSGLSNGSHTVLAQARDTRGALSGAATVTFSVNVNLPPPNNTPVANAGPDQTVDENTTITLDGSGSTDADPDDTLTYAWSQTSGPSVTLSSNIAQKPTFAAPTVTTDTNLTFSLVVTDNKGASSANDTVNILVEDVPIPVNHQPEVKAGDDATADEGTIVNLSGKATDPDSGDTLTISWTQVGSGPSVTLTGSNTLTPSFTAPQVDSDTQVTFRLNATDSHGASAIDDITITIHNVIPSPIGSIRNVNSQVWTDNVGNMLVTSSAEVNSSVGVDNVWIETFDSQSNQWIKRIENTPNSGFNDITCKQTSYLVSGSAGFADKNGCTALPWGFEVWGCYTNSQGKIVCDYSNQAGGGNKKAVDAVFDNTVKFEGTHSAKMTGLYPNATVVMAIPSYPTGNPKFEVGKPDIVPGETYRLEMMVKLENVKGTGCVTVDNPPKDPGFCGFRIFQTFFDTNSAGPKYVYYGPKYTGTSDWFKVTFDAKATGYAGPDSTLVRGDPAIEIAGEGTVWIDGLRFYSLDSASPRDLKIRDATALNVTSTLGTVTYFAPGKTNSPQNKNNELMFTEGTQAAGTYVYMWPDSEITISKWTPYPGSTDNIVKVTAEIAYYKSYGGIATVTASVSGTPYPLNCVFDTTSTAPKVFTCDLTSAGIDTPDEINNLTLKVKLNSASNGSIDSIKIVVDRPPVGIANTWVPVQMTWFVQKTIPDWRIGFSDVSGNVFHS